MSKCICKIIELMFALVLFIHVFGGILGCISEFCYWKKLFGHDFCLFNSRRSHITITKNANRYLKKNLLHQQFLIIWLVFTILAGLASFGFWLFIPIPKFFNLGFLFSKTKCFIETNEISLLGFIFFILLPIILVTLSTIVCDFHRRNLIGNITIKNQKINEITGLSQFKKGKIWAKSDPQSILLSKIENSFVIPSPTFQAKFHSREESTLTILLKDQKKFQNYNVYHEDSLFSGNLEPEKSEKQSMDNQSNGPWIRFSSLNLSRFSSQKGKVLNLHNQGNFNHYDNKISNSSEIVEKHLKNLNENLYSNNCNFSNLNDLNFSSDQFPQANNRNEYQNFRSQAPSFPQMNSVSGSKPFRAKSKSCYKNPRLLKISTEEAFKNYINYFALLLILKLPYHILSLLTKFFGIFNIYKSIVNNNSIILEIDFTNKICTQFSFFGNIFNLKILDVAAWLAYCSCFLCPLGLIILDKELFKYIKQFCNSPITFKGRNPVYLRGPNFTTSRYLRYASNNSFGGYYVLSPPVSLASPMLSRKLTMPNAQKLSSRKNT